MQLFEKRPLALSCALFLCALSLGYAVFDGSPILQILAAFLLAVVAILVILAVRRRRQGISTWRPFLAWILTLSFTAFGFLCAYSCFGVWRGEAEAIAGETEIEFTVEKTVFESDWSGIYEANLRVANGNAVSFGILVSGEVSLSEGDIVRARAILTPFEDSLYDYNDKSAYLADGILMEAELTEVLSTEKSSAFSLVHSLQRLNRRLSAVLSVELKKNVSGFVSGVFLGNREEVPAETRRDFKQLGISHLLALSGLHMTIVCTFFEWILALFPVNRKLKYGGLILLALGYAALTGFSASALRAAVMLSAVYLFFFFGYRRDPVTLLFCVAAGMIAIQPYQLLNPSFQLSFLAMLACLTVKLLRKERKTPSLWWKKALRALLDSMLLSTFVCLVTLPAVSLISANVSLLSPLTNLIFIPLVTLLLYLCPLLFLFRWSPAISAAVTFCINKLTSFLIISANKIASLGVGYLSLNSGLRPALVGTITVLLVLLFVCRKKRKIPLLAATAAAFLLLFAAAGVETAIFGDQVQVTAISYKRNDLFTVETKGRMYLIDLSDGSYSALSKAIYSASADGYNQAKALILTHYHQRHVSAIQRAAEAMYLSSLCLPEPVSEEDKAICDAICRLAREEEIEVVLYPRDETAHLTFSEVEMYVMEYQKLKRSTHSVLAFSIEANGEILVYLGTTVSETGSSFPEQKADILLLGSHGPIPKKQFICAADAVYFCGTAQVDFWDGTSRGTITEKQKFTLK